MIMMESNALVSLPLFTRPLITLFRPYAYELNTLLGGLYIVLNEGQDRKVSICRYQGSLYNVLHIFASFKSRNQS
jgi:hypothetical protein